MYYFFADMFVFNFFFCIACVLLHNAFEWLLWPFGISLFLFVPLLALMAGFQEVDNAKAEGRSTRYAFGNGVSKLDGHSQPKRNRIAHGYCHDIDDTRNGDLGYKTPYRG